jgi:protein dispatched 1
MLFVFCFFIFHLESSFLALAGILIILLSFPITSIICKVFLQIEYFGMLCGLIIFIILGIAADNIFVFFDAWRQSENLSNEVFAGCKKRRLAFAFRRATRAIALTSSTTSAAFMANVFSPLMPIVQFGVYAGIIILVNYVLVVFLFPSATIIYDRYFKNKGCTKQKTATKP